MAKYTIEDTTLVAIADSIRAKTGGVDGITPENMPTEIEGIETGGGTEEIEQIIDQSGVLDSTDGTATEKVEQLIDKAEDENIWYQISAETTKFISITNITIEVLPKLSYAKVTSLAYGFSCPTLKRAPHYINCENCTTAAHAFSGCTLLEYVEGIYTAKATEVNNTFRSCKALHTIKQPLDFSSAIKTTSAFMECIALIEVRFVPETIKVSITIPSAVLSDESIQSIIDGLATVETAQTLTLDADVKAKLTETQLDAITSKNWNLA